MHSRLHAAPLRLNVNRLGIGFEFEAEGFF
jgi:hypothetical protein